jgi:hypothetical protein
MTRRTSPSAPAPPLTVLAGLGLAVLLAHALLLAGLPIGAGDGTAPGFGPMQVRQIVRVSPELPAAQPPARRARPQPAPAAAPAAAPMMPAATPEPLPPAEPPLPAGAGPAPDPAPDPTPALAEAPAAAASEAQPVPDAASAAVAAASTPEPAAASGAVPPALAPAAAGTAPPVYATRVPAPATLRYELRRGVLGGEGELAWRPGADGYELQIEGRAFGMQVLAQTSSGRFDSAGLAPLRFVDRRRGRDARAANFQRDKAIISWSGVTAEQALLAGAQDRLSWMVQLAAIVDADPARFGAGERVLMQVAGARGDVDLWAFGVLGRDAVEVVGARIEGTLALRREPRKPFDTVVEVWLDPARQHLPVRLKLATAGGGDALEFVLKP